MTNLINIFIISILLFGICLAQQSMRATTEDGKQVILNPDGTWRYAEYTDILQGTQSGISKPAGAKQQVTTINKNFRVWIDGDKWNQEKGEDPNRMDFYHVNGDGYAIVIAERIGMPLQSLRNIAVQNAREVASDVKVVMEEKRVVNGTEILCMQMDFIAEQVPFRYFGYYYGSDNGTLQVVTYTAQSLFDEYKQDFEDFLNGTEIMAK